MKTSALEHLPVAVIGAGPVGLAAAAHLIARGLPVKVYEAGPEVGANLRDWGHVRVFTPWRYCLDGAATALLDRHGWRAPEADAFPTGAELVSAYLEPLARTSELAAVLQTNAHVTAISREGMDKVVSHGRETRPFVLAVTTKDGVRRDLARAVIDASGTWATPNPLGASGLPAAGEAECAERISYGIPDILGRDRDTYVGRKTLVVGSGHSAANALLDLAALAKIDPRTSLLWATRSSNLARIFSGGDADQLPARGELGADVRALVDSGRVSLMTGFAVVALHETSAGVVIEGATANGLRRIGPVDRIIAATGQRPDLAMTRELRLDLDPWLESAKALGPLIDPNLHSCGWCPRTVIANWRIPNPASTRSASRATAARRPSCCSQATNRRAPSPPQSPATWRRRMTCGSCCPKPAFARRVPSSKRQIPPAVAAAPRRRKSMRVAWPTR